MITIRNRKVMITEEEIQRKTSVISKYLEDEGITIDHVEMNAEGFRRVFAMRLEHDCQTLILAELIGFHANCHFLAIKSIIFAT